MAKEKRQVRLTTMVTHEPTTGDKELGVRASTKVLGREITASGSDEATAIRSLKAKVDDFIKERAFKAEFPKTVEVDW
jgi:hypothetical protein